jgi:hypothetical protein
MTSPARTHATGLGIQTVPITNCAVTDPARLRAAVDAVPSPRAVTGNGGQS